MNASRTAVPELGTTGEVQVFLYIAAWKPESCNTLPHPLAVKGKGCGFTEGVAILEDFVGGKGGGLPGLGSGGLKANQLWDIIKGIPTFSRSGCSLKRMTFKSHSCLSLGFFFFFWSANLVHHSASYYLQKILARVSRLNSSVPSARAFSLSLFLPPSSPPLPPPYVSLSPSVINK